VRMRPLLYSQTVRDQYFDGGSTDSNILSATVPAASMLVWIEV
jgi:hypothetical protein